jgi:hypothetical protein
MKRSTKLLLLLLAAGAGCDGDDPPGTNPPPDGGALRGVDTTIHVAADGTKRIVPADLSEAIVAVQAPREGGGWTIFPGVGDSSGHFVVPGAPAGERWLRIERPPTDPEGAPSDEYVWTDATELDFSESVVGRTDLEYAQEPTSLVLDADGLEPWLAGSDLLGIYSANTGYVNYLHGDGAGVSGFPAADATALAATTLDWTAAVAPLARASAGDRTLFTQVRLLHAGELAYYAPVAAFEASYTQASGTTTHVQGHFAPGAPFTYRLAWKRSAFEALRAAISPAASASTYHAFGLYSSPGLAADAWSWRTLPVEVISVGSSALEGTSDVDLGDLALRPPFARASLYSFHEVGFGVAVPFDDAITLTLPARIGQYDTHFPDAAHPVVPLASPVRGLQIGGRDAFQPQSGVGVEPVLAWQAPEVGAVSAYRIIVATPFARVPIVDPDLGTDFARVATLDVPGDVTHVQLPDELLVPGVRYLVVVRAIVQPASVDVRRRPHRRALPHAYADAVSALFQP